MSGGEQGLVNTTAALRNGAGKATDGRHTVGRPSPSAENASRGRG